MKTAYVRKPFEFKITDRAVPVPEADEVLLKVSCCGVCGTDLHIAGHLAEDWMTFGHEIVGTVLETGRDVANVTAGDRVTLESSSFCGRCTACRNGRVDRCSAIIDWKKEHNGGFAECMTAPGKMLVPIGDMEPAAASLAEPLGVALDLVKTVEIEPGNSVLVIGPGPIGLMAVSLARLYGAGRVLLAGIKSDCKRMEIGRAMGADELIYSDEPGWAKAFEGGIDRVLLTAAPALIGETVQCMRFAGIIAYLGIAYGDGSRVLLDGNEFHFKRLQLRASYAVPALFFPRALELLRRDSIRSDLLISHRFPLAEISDAFDLLRHSRGEALKVVIEMGGDAPA